MDKNVKLSTLAALGLIAGSIETLHAAPPPGMTQDGRPAPACTPATVAQIQSLFAQLDAKHQEMFNKLDCEGQNLAVEMAEQTCAGKNLCAGRNACKTKDHSCRGKGSCQGTATMPFKDKNKAVEVAKKMSQKRQSAMS